MYLCNVETRRKPESSIFPDPARHNELTDKTS